MTQAIEKHPYSAAAVVAIVLLAASAISLITPRPALSQNSPTSLAGYAWSDNIGWIDLNCSNSGVCGGNPFGFSINGSGVLSGYAWSDNIGWISANASDLAGCPSAPCTATLSNGTLSGWLKALSADNNGWDGFISLHGSNYGVTDTNGVFSGYAWGSDVVGWVSFSSSYTPCTPATTYTCSGNTIVRNITAPTCQVTSTNLSPACAAPSFCSAGSAVCLYPQPSFIQTGDLTGHLQAAPLIVPAGIPTTLYWNVAGVSSCVVSGSDGENFSGLSSGTNGQPTALINQQTIFTLACSPDDPSTTYASESEIGRAHV